jgi:hypothetical protein
MNLSQGNGRIVSPAKRQESAAQDIQTQERRSTTEAWLLKSTLKHGEIADQLARVVGA